GRRPEAYAATWGETSAGVDGWGLRFIKPKVVRLGSRGGSGGGRGFGMGSQAIGQRHRVATHVGCPNGKKHCV
ncbi:MAG: hypothetical protein ACK5TO_00640, partial [Planctomycetaceae bacterium]